MSSPRSRDHAVGRTACSLAPANPPSASPAIGDSPSWYNSDAYQAVIGERHAAADSNAVIVGGFEMPGS